MLTKASQAPPVRPASHSYRIRSALPSASYALLLIGIALAPFNVYRLRGSIIVSDAFLFGAGALAFIDLLAARTRLWAPLPLLLAAALTWLGFLVPLLQNGVVIHPFSVDFLTLFYTCYLLPIIIASQRIRDPRQVRVLIYVWLIATMAQAIVIVCQSRGIQLPSFIQDKLVTAAYRAAGLTMHPNAAGLFLCLPVPVCFACAIGARGWRSFLGWIGCTALLVYAIDKTGSRAALLASLVSCIGVSAIFMVVRNKSRWMRAAIIAALGAGAVLLLLGGDPASALDRLFGNENASVANVERAGLNARFITYFWENPFFGNGYNLDGIHNVFIGTLGLAGIVGFMALVLREALFAWQAIRILQLVRSMHGDSALAAGLPMVYVVWVLISIKGFVIVDRVGFIGIGLMVLFYIHRPRNESQKPQFPPATNMQSF